MGGSVGGGVAPGACVAVGRVVGRGVAAVVDAVAGAVTDRGAVADGVADGVVTSGLEGVDVALCPAGEGEELWAASGGVAGVVAEGVGGSVGGTAPGAGPPHAERAITKLTRSPRVAGGMARRELVMPHPNPPAM